MDAISDVSRASQIFSAVPARSPLPDPLEIDTLFEFKDESKGKYVEESVIDVRYFDKNKIFVNHIDSFIGKYLVSVLSRKDLRINKVEQEMEEKNVEETKREDTTPKKGGNTASEVGSKLKGKTDSPTKTKEASDKTKSDKKKKNSLRSAKEPALHVSDNFEDLRYSVFDEKVVYDTSKLTVAEYFEMMELEAGEPREEYLKEKLDEFKIIIPSLQQHLTKDSKRISKNEMNIGDFEIVGTLRNNEVSEELVKGVAEIIHVSQENQSFIKHMAKCGVIVYNVIDDSDQVVEASWVLNSLSHYIQELKEDETVGEFSPPLFILVSTFMTWSLSKSLYPNIPDLPFTEKDFRKRQHHPNYQLHYELEEQVIRTKSGGEIDAVILTCGIPYGHEESVFSYFFHTAFNRYLDIPVYYGSGQNFIPVIHVENIGLIVREVIKKAEQITLPFLFAKDPISFYKKDVIKAINHGLGFECYKIMPEQFAFLEDAVTQDIYDQTMANVYMESCFPLFHEQDIKWKYANGLVEDIKYVVKEFMDAKNLKPLNIVIYSDSLKNMENLPQRLSQYYYSQYLNLDAVVQDYVSEMLAKITRLEEQNIVEDSTQRSSMKSNKNNTKTSDITVEEYCEDTNLDNSLEVFRKLNIKYADDISKLSKMQKISILNEKLRKRICLIHGYVLDDFPKNLNEAQSLFSTDYGNVSENDDFNEFPRLPDYVIYLKQTEEDSPEVNGTGDDSHYYPKEEISMIPNNRVKESLEENTQEVVVERKMGANIDNIMENRTEEQKRNKLSAPELEVVNFFLDENKNCKVIEVEINEIDSEDRVFKEVVGSIIPTGTIDKHGLTDPGKPCEEVDILQVLEQKTIKEEEKLVVEKETGRKTQEEKSRQSKNAEETTVIAIRSCPYISYLIQYLYPTLTDALLEVATRRPEDPLDFLAEYLFKNNPDGRMVDPTKAKREEEEKNKDLRFPNIGSKACLA